MCIVTIVPGGDGGRGAPLPPMPGGISYTQFKDTQLHRKNIKDDNQMLLWVVFNKNMYKSCLLKRFSTIFTALFYPYIAHERTLRIWIMSVRSSLFFSLSAIAHKIMVRSRAKSDRAISKSDAPSSGKRS